MKNSNEIKGLPQTQVKTIDITAKEWFDKTAGNSYFSAHVTVNFGLDGSAHFCLPFQYGYGNHYVDMATDELEKRGYLPEFKRHENGSTERLWNYCDRFKIVLRYDKHENCLKREVTAFGLCS